MKGLSHWINKKNKFGVVQLHYTADPDKDPATEKGRTWYDRARSGMPEEGWQREYEINWSSGAGRPVYPDFTTRQAVKLKWQPEWIVHRGWDRGFYHPACHWSCLNNSKSPQWLWLYEKLGQEVGAHDFIAECLEITLAKFPNALIIDWFPPDTKTPSDIPRKDDERSFLDVAQNVFSLSPNIITTSLKDRINIIRRRMLLRADGEYGLLVDKDSCPICLEALKGGYHRNPKEEKGDDVVKDGYYDHLMDAASHTAAGIFTLIGEALFTNYMDSMEEVEPDYARNPVTGFIEA